MTDLKISHGVGDSFIVKKDETEIGRISGIDGEAGKFEFKFSHPTASRLDFDALRTLANYIEDLENNWESMKVDFYNLRDTMVNQLRDMETNAARRLSNKIMGITL